MRLVEERDKGWSRDYDRHGGRCQGGKVRGMFGRVRCGKLVPCGNGTLTAFVSICRRQALSLGATGGGFTCECSAKAVEGPRKRQDYKKRNRNVNAASHPSTG
jgi:hypothetical protein